jgi:DNA adenine methylase
MRPPTTYYGGKTRLAPLIASLLPEHRTYVEPFAGSGAVLFAKRPSPTEVLNDLDGQVVNFFQTLRDQPEALARACELTPYARAEYDACTDLDVADPVERARRWWVRTNQSIAKHPGSRRGTGWAAAPSTSSRDHPDKLMVLAARMRACAERLRPVTIECRPALEVLAKYATRADVVVYADPPYLASTRAGLDRKRLRDYDQEMAGEDDHRALAEVLQATPATVLLSGYDSPLYAELYAGWWHLEVPVTRPSSNGHGRPMAWATEVIWSNRPLAGQLRLEQLEEPITEEVRA